MSPLDELKKILIKNGASFVGFANLSSLDIKTRKDFNTGISILRNLHCKLPA